MSTRAKPNRPTLFKLPLEDRRWLEQRSQETGETMTKLVLQALGAAKKKQARIERRAQREAGAR